MFASWYQKFSSQPHQPFFALGMLIFIFLLFLLFVVYSGMAAIDATIFQIHAYPIIFTVFIQFFLGFLFVVFPRFLMQAIIPPSVYMKHFYLFAGGSALYIIGLIFLKPFIIVASLLLFVAQIHSFSLLYSIYKKSIVKDKYDTKWVLIAFSFGIVANFCALLSFLGLNSPFLERFAINIGFYLFLFMLIFAISQRMIPHFTEIKVPGYKVNKTRYLMEALFFLLLFKLFFTLLDAPKLYFLADIPIALFFIMEFSKWKLPATRVPPIVWVLYLSLAWIPIGFLFSGVESIFTLARIDLVFEKAALHILALGYFLTILIGFATRVVLGHSGRVPTADRTTVAIFYFVQFATVIRIVAAFSPNFGDYGFWIALSAAVTLAVLFAWCIKYFKILAISF